MEGTPELRQDRKRKRSGDGNPEDDVVMEEAPRKIVIVRKRKQETKLLDEDGNELEFEDSDVEEEAEEEVIQRDDEDWEDEDVDSENDDKQA